MSALKTKVILNYMAEIPLNKAAIMGDETKKCDHHHDLPLNR